MKLFGWFRKRQPELMSDEEWEAAKAELRRRAFNSVPDRQRQRAEALRIIMASGVRYPRDGKK